MGMFKNTLLLAQQGNEKAVALQKNKKQIENRTEK